MIDRRIFYCWFGDNEISDFEKKCMDSWKKQCPNYEIVRIDESNFDIDKYPYAREAYRHGNFSFVSDVARLWILSIQSGFYLDTDIKLLKPLDELRQYDAFVTMSGKGFYTCGQLGCSGFPHIYREALERLQDGRVLNELINEITYANYDVYGQLFAEIDNIAFLGNQYFITAGYRVSKETIGIHYCHGSWLDKWQGDFDKRNTFKTLQVYQDGTRDINFEKKIYGRVIEDADGTLHVTRTPATKDHILCANYLYNPNVVTVQGSGFTIRRNNAKPVNAWDKVEDLAIGRAI